MEKLRMRMNWDFRNGRGTFSHIDIRSNNEKVLVWVITADFQSVVLEDTDDLFPSDTLVTQLRVLQ